MQKPTFAPNLCDRPSWRLVSSRAVELRAGWSQDGHKSEDPYPAAPSGNWTPPEYAHQARAAATLAVPALHRGGAFDRLRIADRLTRKAGLLQLTREALVLDLDRDVLDLEPLV